MIYIRRLKKVRLKQLKNYALIRHRTISYAIELGALEEVLNLLLVNGKIDPNKTGMIS